ncbi:hypothetical protein MHBO_000276 [Bonamia ostreae]|uniref:Uncharacterized protein n=1 Tax=Bonamia ostreae TaxID=126728 RepID=A0ABV2AF17_9EUKA
MYRTENILYDNYLQPHRNIKVICKTPFGSTVKHTDLFCEESGLKISGCNAEAQELDSDIFCNSGCINKSNLNNHNSNDVKNVIDYNNEVTDYGNNEILYHDNDNDEAKDYDKDNDEAKDYDNDETKDHKMKQIYITQIAVITFISILTFAIIVILVYFVLNRTNIFERRRSRLIQY